MNNYRVKEVDGKFYPQERFFFFFWDYVKLEDRESRDWFVQSAEANCYDGTVTYLIAKDAWGATHWIRPGPPMRKTTTSGNVTNFAG